MQQVQLNVDDEVKALGDALKVLIIDIKAKKGVTAIVSDVLPGLVAAVGGYQALPADMKKVDNQAFLAKCLGDALEG